MSDLFVERWGTGTPVVLVHGSLATGTDEWQAQRPLADQGFQLVVFDRRGYGQSPAASSRARRSTRSCSRCGAVFRRLRCRDSRELQRASAEERKHLRHLGQNVIAVSAFELVNACAIPSFISISGHEGCVSFHDRVDGGVEIRIEKEGE